MEENKNNTEVQNNIASDTNNTVNAQPKTENLENKDNSSTELAGDEKIYALLGYIWVFFLIPLILKPKSKFCQLHARQSGVLFALWVVSLPFFIIPTLALLFQLALMGLACFGMYQAFQGLYFQYPGINMIAPLLPYEVFIENIQGKGKAMKSSDVFEGVATKVKVEATPEVKVEATPEVKVEATPEVKVEATPEENKETNN